MFSIQRWWLDSFTSLTHYSLEASPPFQLLLGNIGKIWPLTPVVFNEILKTSTLNKGSQVTRVEKPMMCACHATCLCSSISRGDKLFSSQPNFCCRGKGKRPTVRILLNAAGLWDCAIVLNPQWGKANRVQRSQVQRHDSDDLITGIGNRNSRGHQTIKSSISCYLKLFPFHAHAMTRRW